MNLINNQLNYLYKSISDEIETIECKLQKMPPGYITYERTGKYYKYFQTDDGIRTYIPKSNNEFAQKLALKKYLSTRLKYLNGCLKILSNTITKIKKIKTCEDKFLSCNAYTALLKSHQIFSIANIAQWASEPYESNASHPETRKYNSISGNTLRSKSEVFIDQALYFNKIPYRYECKLMLSSIALYPDFTIMHPTTGKILYWEHFGMMDNQQYLHNAMQKIQLYASNGIIPGIDLIMTFETKEQPFTYKDAEDTLRHYLHI